MKLARGELGGGEVYTMEIFRFELGLRLVW
jgi:hypothetical protein